MRMLQERSQIAARTCPRQTGSLGALVSDQDFSQSNSKDFIRKVYKWRCCRSAHMAGVLEGLVVFCQAAFFFPARFPARFPTNPTSVPSPDRVSRAPRPTRCFFSASHVFLLGYLLGFRLILLIDVDKKARRKKVCFLLHFLLGVAGIAGH